MKISSFFIRGKKNLKKKHLLFYKGVLYFIQCYCSVM